MKQNEKQVTELADELLENVTGGASVFQPITVKPILTKPIVKPIIKIPVLQCW